MICDITHWINGFLGRSGCNQNLLSLKILLLCDFSQNIGKQRFRLRHLAGPGIPTGKITTCRLDHFVSIMLKRFEIILQDRIFKHICIHGRGNKFLTFACHKSCCQHIICDPMCKLADHIGTGRCDHRHICLLCDRNMLYLELEVSVKGIYQTFRSGKRFKCNRCNEVRCILRHQHMYFRMKLLQCTCKICNFVCRNASGDSQKNSFTL